MNKIEIEKTVENVRTEAKRQNVALTRDNIPKIVDIMREVIGKDYVESLAIELQSKSENALIGTVLLCANRIGVAAKGDEDYSDLVEMLVHVNMGAKDIMTSLEKVQIKDIEGFDNIPVAGNA